MKTTNRVSRLPGACAATVTFPRSTKRLYAMPVYDIRLIAICSPASLLDMQKKIEIDRKILADSDVYVCLPDKYLTFSDSIHSLVVVIVSRWPTTRVEIASSDGEWKLADRGNVVLTHRWMRSIATLLVMSRAEFVCIDLAAHWSIVYSHVINRIRIC